VKQPGETIDFIRGLAWADVPAQVRARIGLLLRDFVAVSLAGRATPTARIAAEYAADEHRGDGATALFDGSRLSATGAAWANGVLANALDFDDGHRLVKGHPGANVIPAALASAETAGASLEEFLAAVAAGYEVAIRAGIALHGRSTDYHASGAWGGVGAASASARLLGLGATETAHALGLAEYHAPIAPVMRSVADPAMTKDACGQGAWLGISSARMAKRGFTATASTFLNESAACDLGERWRVLETYVKKFPCCRWSHPAIEAALGLHHELGLDAERITGVRVTTFSAAAALSRRHPTTTEEAQYSLVWPVAASLARGRFGIDEVLPAAFEDPAAACLKSLIDVEVDAGFDEAFPGRRLGRVSVECAGRRYGSDVTEAPGDPEDPGWEEIVQDKFECYASSVPPRDVARDETLSSQGIDGLLSLLAGAGQQASYSDGVE